ncbi:FdtA/QdtA family cupin domain-containing protein [Candidatus Daviesbacteria bacterium]|nr:FdtA/QdtA family cupin domain-containing protein [Candidatus Daviesbacteria bacterium]
MAKSLIKLINIPKIEDDCYLLFAQTPDHVPFKIKRIYLILEADPRFKRGKHAHKKILFCIKGSIKMVLNNGFKKEEVILDKPEQGLIIDNLIWHEMNDFKKETILLVLASQTYQASDYIRDYRKFLKSIGKVNDKKY